MRTTNFLALAWVLSVGLTAYGEDGQWSVRQSLDAGVRLVGRWDVGESQARCQWPATGLELRFEGKQLSIALEDSGSGEPHAVEGFQSNYLDVIVEGMPRRVLRLEPGVTSYPIVDAPSGFSGMVLLFKRTESNVGAIGWHGFQSDPSGRLAALPTPPARIDFYGDSDACGYGVEAKDEQVPYCPATENAEKSFAVQAMLRLGYDLHLIAASGWGIARGYGGESELAIPRVARRVFIDEPTPEADRKTPPDVIVVCLGDNDFHQGDPGQAFDDAYHAFVKMLHDDAPRAKIFLCVGTSMSDQPEKPNRTRLTQTIDSIAAAINPARGTAVVHRIDIKPYDSAEGYGADWHTSAAGHQRIGSEIASAIAACLEKGSRAEGER
jgi:hypothetical protein